MNSWGWSLLLKPVIGLAMIAAYYFVIIKGLRWLYPRLPKNRLVEALFRERGKGVEPQYGPGHDSVVRERRSSGSGSGTELQ